MKSPSFRKYVLLSLAFHILVAGTMLIVEQLTPPPVKTETVSINFLSPDDLEKIAQADKPQAKKPLTVSANQIVEQNETSANEEVPVNSRFLSVKNQKVEKQTERPCPIFFKR